QCRRYVALCAADRYRLAIPAALLRSAGGPAHGLADSLSARGQPGLSRAKIAAAPGRRHLQHCGGHGRARLRRLNCLRDVRSVWPAAISVGESRAEETPGREHFLTPCFPESSKPWALYARLSRNR